MDLAALARRLPAEFQITLVDVGSAGGLHKRWKPVRNHVSAILFDPLDEAVGSPRDRYFPVALGEGPGHATLNVTRRVSMTSTLLPNAARLAHIWDKPAHTEVVKTIDVATDLLDNIVDANGLSIDAIKIDVQGGEYGILKGAAQCLERSIMLAEVEGSFFDRYVGLRPFHEIVGLMLAHGLELVDISRIKRYRFRNASGVVKPGLGGGDRPGRIAFCDAIFLRSDDRLLQQLQAADGQAALKAIMVLLVYGKADIAAWVFDAAADTLDPAARNAVAGYLSGLSGKKYGRKALHLALDYLAKRV